MSGEMLDKKVCRRCGSTRNAKWGKRKGKQAYKCGDCGFQFTREDERKSEKDTRRAVALYCCGFSFCAIGKILNYHNTTVLKRIKEFINSKEQATVSKQDIILELNEIKELIISKGSQLSLGKQTDMQVKAFLEGDYQIQTPQIFQSCIKIV